MGDQNSDSSNENLQSLENKDTEKSLLTEPQKDKAITYELKQIKCFCTTIDLPLASLMIMNFFINAACSVITPFFPPLGNKIGLNSLEVGFVIGIHPLSGFLFGMVMSKYLMNFGRKKVMLVSLFVTVLTLIGMGLSYLIKGTPIAFFIVNLICRSFMGMARSGYGSATFAYAPMLWPQKVEKMIGLLESATGLGLMTGPLIGALIKLIFSGNEGLQYQMVFYILSFVFLIAIYPSYTMLPFDQKIPPKQKTLSLFKVLGRRQIWTLYFLLTLTGASVAFTYELWTTHLATYGVKETLSAVYLTAGSCTYIVALQVIPRLMGVFIRKRGIINFRKLLEACGLGFSAFLLLFMAPETTIGIPQQVWPLIIGMFGAGFAQGMVILPFIPEQNSLIIRLYPKNEKKILTEKLTEQVEQQMQQVEENEGKKYTEEDVEANVGEIIRKLYSDMAAGMFMSGYSLGTFSGPTLGGFVFDMFEKTHAAETYPCDIARALPDSKHPCANQYAFQQLARCILLLDILFLIFYVTLGEGWIGFRDTCCRKKQKIDVDMKQVKRSFSASNEYKARDGNLTDALLTDSAMQFTDADPQADFDEETEDKLAKIIEKTENEARSSEGAARSGSLIM